MNLYEGGGWEGFHPPMAKTNGEVAMVKSACGFQPLAVNNHPPASRWINMAEGDVEALIALYCSKRATSPADGLLNGHNSRVATGIKRVSTAVLTFRFRCILSTRAALSLS